MRCQLLSNSISPLEDTVEQVLHNCFKFTRDNALIVYPMPHLLPCMRYYDRSLLHKTPCARVHDLMCLQRWQAGPRSAIGRAPDS